MNVLILGGGPGGLMVANRLKELCGDRYKITVIDKELNLHIGASLLHVMIGEKSSEEIKRNRENLNKKGIVFFNDDVSEIDCNKRIVRTLNDEISYDYLVIALGSELAPHKIKGLEESEYYNMYTLNNAEKLRDALNAFTGGKIVIAICGLPFKCPAAPYEAAMLINSFLKKRGLLEKTKIKIFTPEPFPIPLAGPDNGKKIIELLASKGIVFYSNQELAEVKGGDKELVFKNGQKEKYDLLVAIPQHVCPKVVKESGLSDDSGWIPVNEKTLETRFENVFAIGDVAAIRLVSGKFLPKAAAFALGQGEVVAYNLASRILNVEKKNWDGIGECYIETGDNMAGLGSGNFYTTPSPIINMQMPSEIFYQQKELWKRYWLNRLL